MLLIFIKKRFLWTLFLVYFVVLSIFYVYEFSNFFITYHTKSAKALFDTLSYFLPIVLFYTSTINIVIGFFTTSYYLKRIKMFSVSQSFGVPPWHIFKPFLVLSFLLSLLNVGLNEYFIPSSVSNLKYIEHIYKKNQSYELGVARNIWIANEKGNEKIFIGGSLVSSDGDFYDFKLVNIKNNNFNYIIKAKKALLKGDRFYMEDGELTYISPYKNEAFKSMDIKSDVELSKLSLWTKTPDEESLTDLIKTIFILRKEGLNIYPYLSILVFKILFSFLPFFMVGILSFYVAKSQKTKDWYKAFFIHGILFGICIVIPYSISSKLNINPFYFSPIYTLIILYLIKRLRDLKKGIWL